MTQSLDEFLTEVKPKGLTAKMFAERLRITPSTLNSIRHGHRPCQPFLALLIEKFSVGKVLASSLPTTEDSWHRLVLLKPELAQITPWIVPWGKGEPAPSELEPEAQSAQVVEIGR